MRVYINGVFIECDCCGKQRFIRGNLGNVTASGWKIKDNKDFCPECWKKINEKLPNGR